MLLTIILTNKIIFLIIILFLSFFLLGYRIASVRASKMFAKMMLDLQKGNVHIKIIKIEEEKKEKDKR